MTSTSQTQPPSTPQSQPGRRAQAEKNKHQRERAAAQRLRHRRLGVVGAAVLVVAVAAGIGIAASGGSSPSAPLAAGTVPSGATAAGGMFDGAASAPVHLVAYEDPQCPICGQFEQLNGATLQAAVKAGKVQVEYRMLSFLGPESVRADNALAAAQAEGRFEALREQLYAHQPEEKTGGFTNATLISLGAAVGLTDPAYVTAVNAGTYDDFVAAVAERASKDKVNGTPTVLKDGVPLTSQQLFTAPAFAAAIASA